MRHQSAAARAIRAAACVLMVAPACGRQERPLPPAPAVVNVVMREYAFDHDKPLLSPGRAAFRVQNRGRLAHQLILLSIPPDAPSVEELFGSAGKKLGLSPLAILPDQPAGDRSSFAYDLGPGRYAFVCILKIPEGGTHAERGMSSEFRVRGSSG